MIYGPIQCKESNLTILNFHSMNKKLKRKQFLISKYSIKI